MGLSAWGFPHGEFEALSSGHVFTSPEEDRPCAAPAAAASGMDRGVRGEESGK